MSNDTKQIHNVETNEIQIIELTDDEQAIKDAEGEANRIAKQAEAQAKATQKAALLERLGITEDEAKLLLG
jgi:vacuolar-type H+-ATPase subunit H